MLGLFGDLIGARIAGSSTKEATSKSTTSTQLYQLQAGMIGQVSSNVCSAQPISYKSFVSRATKSNPRGKTMSDGALRAKLKSTLERAKRDLLVNVILKQAEAILGNDNFVAEQDARFLADIDHDKLEAFFQAVKKVRTDVDTEFYFTLKSLVGDDNEQDSSTD